MPLIGRGGRLSVRVVVRPHAERVERFRARVTSVHPAACASTDHTPDSYTGADSIAPIAKTAGGGDAGIFATHDLTGKFSHRLLAGFMAERKAGKGRSR